MAAKAPQNLPRPSAPRLEPSCGRKQRARLGAELGLAGRVGPGLGSGMAEGMSGVGEAQEQSNPDHSDMGVAGLVTKKLKPATHLQDMFILDEFP